MSFEHHDRTKCDRCEKNPKKWIVPFLYKDMNDKAHKDMGQGYRQYEICNSCQKKEQQQLALQYPGEVFIWEKIKKS
jgi:hypothetical protein